MSNTPVIQKNNRFVRTGAFLGYQTGEDRAGETYHFATFLGNEGTTSANVNAHTPTLEVGRNYTLVGQPGTTNPNRIYWNILTSEKPVFKKPAPIIDETV